MRKVEYDIIVKYLEKVQNLDVLEPYKKGFRCFNCHENDGVTDFSHLDPHDRDDPITYRACDNCHTIFEVELAVNDDIADLEKPDGSIEIPEKYYDKSIYYQRRIKTVKIINGIDLVHAPSTKDIEESYRHSGPSGPPRPR